MTIETYVGRNVNEEEALALRDFIEVFGASLDYRLWIKLIAEELEELVMALAYESPENQLKELADVRYVAVGASLVKSPYIHSLVGDDDEIVPIIQKSDETLEKIITHFNDAFTIEQAEEAFRRVHASNMSKLDEEGKPIRREDGKILKGPNYVAPDLSDLVERKAA